MYHAGHQERHETSAGVIRLGHRGNRLRHRIQARTRCLSERRQQREVSVQACHVEAYCREEIVDIGHAGVLSHECGVPSNKSSNSRSHRGAKASCCAPRTRRNARTRSSRSEGVVMAPFYVASGTRVSSNYCRTDHNTAPTPASRAVPSTRSAGRECTEWRSAMGGRGPTRTYPGGRG
jgi:hypothetical protein